ncbi:MAG: cupredoxin family copper-binding protein [Thermomicrobia bacterium]|nr:cupredoxin family copper-binding protein [Thermomicrobia bacterium]
MREWQLTASPEPFNSGDTTTAAPPTAPAPAQTSAAAGSGSGTYGGTYGGGSYGNVTTANTAPAAAATNTNSVTIANFAFAPKSITVAPGQMVTWTNKDSTTHTVTEGKGAWDSKNLAPGATFQQKFDQAGTFTYHCAIHASMTGTVVVKG